MKLFGKKKENKLPGNKSAEEFDRADFGAISGAEPFAGFSFEGMTEVRDFGPGRDSNQIPDWAGVVSEKPIGPNDAWLKEGDIRLSEIFEYYYHSRDEYDHFAHTVHCGKHFHTDDGMSVHGYTVVEIPRNIKTKRELVRYLIAEQGFHPLRTVLSIYDVISPSRLVTAKVEREENAVKMDMSTGKLYLFSTQYYDTYEKDEVIVEYSPEQFHELLKRYGDEEAKRRYRGYNEKNWEQYI